MRILGLIAPVMLSGCTLLSPVIEFPNLSGQTDPYPADYAQIVSREILKKDEAAEVSRPQRTEPWSVTDPIQWYVCVKRGSAVTVLFLRNGRVAGKIEKPEPGAFCGAAEYEPVMGPSF